MSTTWDSGLRGIRRIALDGAIAVTLLTILPVPTPAVVDAAQLRRASVWFPLVGAAVGTLAGGLLYLSEPRLGSTVAAVLAVVALAMITGALHLDGLADTADALGIRGDRQRRLAVMRDPTVGVFGVLALTLAVLLVVSALASMPRRPAFESVVAFVTLSRLAALPHTQILRPARMDGLAANFSSSTGAVVAAVLTALVVTLAVLGPFRAAAAIVASAVMCSAATLLARRLVGGRTGDTTGATITLTEVGVCLTLLAVGR